MLKRLLLTAALAASPLLVTGTISTPAQAAEASRCASAEQITLTPAGTARRCEWRRGCYYCYRNGHWNREYCRSGGGRMGEHRSRYGEHRFGQHPFGEHRFYDERRTGERGGH
ncbi:hypothetical protein ABT294_14500 [Nonomuraea sp. NPDC000554]|uniref:hypothetical protein n=1 Tax=Nonomuraea sp. NPDC000554 TaxID=3154259 RepID=UPI00331800E0